MTVVILKSGVVLETVDYYITFAALPQDQVKFLSLQKLCRAALLLPSVAGQVLSDFPLGSAPVRIVSDAIVNLPAGVPSRGFLNLYKTPAANAAGGA